MALTLALRPTSSSAAASVPRSQQEKMWLAGGAVVGLLLAVIAYFFFISPQRSDTDTVNDQIDSAQTQDATLQARIESLRQQNQNLAKYQSDLAKARLALPTTSGIPAFVRSLQSIGGATNTQLTSLTVATPVAVTPAGASTASASASPAANPPAAATTGDAASSVYSLQLVAQITGTPVQLNDFLLQLQAVQPRAVLITAITEGTGAATGAHSAATSTTLGITMKAFFAPPAASTTPSPAPSHP